MALIRQTSFAAGELSPTLHGRSDLDVYGAGLAKCRNFVVTPHGTLDNRSGTKYIQATRSNAAARLIPFIYSDSQTYVLEFTHHVIRFYCNGVCVQSGGFPVEVATTYDVTSLSTLKFAQSGDILTIVHPTQPPQELRRTGHTVWALTTISFGSPAYTAAWLTGAAPTATESGSSGFPRKVWNWKLTQVGAVGTHGAITPQPESLPSPPIGTGFSLAGYDLADMTNNYPVVIRTGYDSIGKNDAFNVYRGRDDIYGYVGMLTTNGLGVGQFMDIGDTPDWTRQPPKGTNPFGSAGNYPSVVAYFEQRRVFANTTNKPNGIWGSAVGNIAVFDTVIPGQDTDSYDFVLSTLRREEIRSLVPLRAMVALTNSSEWQISGSQGGALSPTSVDARAHAHDGASWLDPVVIGNVAIFVQGRGSLVRDLVFDFQSDSYSGGDISLLSSHFFAGRSIVDMAAAQVPGKVVWCVRDDGVLLGLTYVREQKVIAWHQHTTDGTVENVCVVPEGGEDVTYLVVKRTINGSVVRYVERMDTRLISDIRTANFLDCALPFDGRNTGSVTMRVNGPYPDYTNESQVYIDASAASFAATDIGDRLVLDPNGLALKIEITEYFTTTKVLGIVMNDIAAPYQDIATTNWAWARDTLSGLSHLEGKSVTVLADGEVQGPYTVTSGIVSLSPPAVLAQVGLPIDAVVGTLDVSVPKFETKPNYKTVSKVIIEVEASRGLWVGETEDDVREWIQRDVSDNYGLIGLATDQVEVRIDSTSNKGGRVVIKQVDPLPLTILGITRDVDLGGA